MSTKAASVEIAYHEAAHAVFPESRAHGVVNSATVVPHGNSLGSVRLVAEVMPIADRLATLFVGAEAQRRGMPPGHLAHDGAAEDEAVARGLALEHNHAVGASPTELLVVARRRAAEFVRGPWWPVIEHVAAELVRCGTLDGSEVRRHIEFAKEVYMRPAWWIGKYAGPVADREVAQRRAKRAPRLPGERRHEHPGHVATESVTVLYDGSLIELKAGVSQVADGHELVRRFPQYFEELA